MLPSRMHSEKDLSYGQHPGSLPGSHPGSRHASVGSKDAPSIIALAEYLQQQHLQQQQQQQLPIDLTTPPSGHLGPSITLDQLSNVHAYRNHHQQQQQQQQQPELYDGSLLGSMLSQHHYHLATSGPSSPGSPINPNHNQQGSSPAPSVYGGASGNSDSMSPTKKLSKPLIEKRRRDRINRCLRLLKELVIDSKRFPVANMNKSRFEKADILEITVKYLMMIQQEDRRMFQLGFSACHSEISKLVQEVTKLQAEAKEQDAGDNGSTGGDVGAEESMIHDGEEEATLEEAPKSKSPPAPGPDYGLVEQLCARLAQLGEQIAAEQQIQQQRTASLTNLVLELSEIKSRSASITSDHSGEVTPTSGHLQHQASIEDLLHLDGMRIYESDEEPSSMMIKQYFSRQNSVTTPTQQTGSPSGSGGHSGSVIRHTSNYAPDANQLNHHHQHHHQKSSQNAPWLGSDSRLHGNPKSPQHQLLYDQQQRHHLHPMYQNNHHHGQYHRSGSLSSVDPNSSASSTSSQSSSSSSSSSSSNNNNTNPTPSSAFKAHPAMASTPTPTDANSVTPHWTQSPFFTELNMNSGNERNSGAMSSYESIWRPWGFNS